MTKDVVASVADWDATAPRLRADPRAACDELRERCPVTRDAAGTWMVLRHEDVRRAALDDVTFSSAVSRFRSVPNSLDGDEHRRFRKVVERFLAPARIDALVPMLREVADALFAGQPRGVTVDAVEELGLALAVRAQSLWLGWPAALEQTLRDWVRDNQAATRSGELARTRAVAARFDAIVREQVTALRDPAAGMPREDTVTAELARAEVEDPEAPGGRRVLTEAETVSILRNWTSGDLGSVARAFGGVVHYIATHGDVQQRLRDRVDDNQALDHAIDEILRIDDPFLLNRRVTTREVEIGGRTLPEGARVLLNWTAANRDPKVFGSPEAYRPEQNGSHNLVYGFGPHVCPGRALATHELREGLTALLHGTATVTLAPNELAARASWPLGGYARVPIVLG